MYGDFSYIALATMLLRNPKWICEGISVKLATVFGCLIELDSGQGAHYAGHVQKENERSYLLVQRRRLVPP